MPPIVVHINLAGWLSLGGLYLGLTAVAWLFLKAAGIDPREMEAGLWWHIGQIIFAAGLLIWTVAVLIHCDLIAPEACRPFDYLFHLSAR
jgi:hypothetical protein